MDDDDILEGKLKGLDPIALTPDQWRRRMDFLMVEILRRHYTDETVVALFNVGTKLSRGEI